MDFSDFRQAELEERMDNNIELSGQWSKSTLWQSIKDSWHTQAVYIADNDKIDAVGQ